MACMDYMDPWTRHATSPCEHGDLRFLHPFFVLSPYSQLSPYFTHFHEKNINLHKTSLKSTFKRVWCQFMAHSQDFRHCSTSSNPKMWIKTQQGKTTIQPCICSFHYYVLKIMEKIRNLKWERLQNLFDTISWFLVKSPGFLPEISWFSKFWSGMAAGPHCPLSPKRLLNLITHPISSHCYALLYLL